MYCIKCGVKLAYETRACPLCGTVPYHPEISQMPSEPTYPPFVKREKKMKRWLAMLLLTVFYALLAGELMVCDAVIASRLTWSLFAVGAMAFFYVSALLPLWFKKPNPVIFVPCAFVAAEGYLLAVSLLTDGGWFMRFAFPVAGILGLAATAVVTLVKYLKKGYFFVFGGAVIALGGYIVAVELFATYAFDAVTLHLWSLYPASGALILGGILIAIGACRPLRNWFARKFFI